jgi:hypothetical protein
MPRHSGACSRGQEGWPARGGEETALALRCEVAWGNGDGHGARCRPRQRVCSRGPGQILNVAFAYASDLHHHHAPVCPLCSVGCGVEVCVQAGRGGLEGRSQLEIGASIFPHNSAFHTASSTMPIIASQVFALGVVAAAGAVAGMALARRAKTEGAEPRPILPPPYESAFEDERELARRGVVPPPGYYTREAELRARRAGQRLESGARQVKEEVREEARELEDKAEGFLGRWLHRRPLRTGDEAPLAADEFTPRMIVKAEENASRAAEEAERARLEAERVAAEAAAATAATTSFGEKVAADRARAEALQREARALQDGA